jgi:hypothetical protein
MKETSSRKRSYDFLDLPTQLLAVLDQRPSLATLHRNASGQLGPKNFVLGFEKPNQPTYERKMFWPCQSSSPLHTFGGGPKRTLNSQTTAISELNIERSFCGCNEEGCVRGGLYSG